MIILEIVKVISYENLKETRVKRVFKDVVKVKKKDKRDWKTNNVVLEVQEAVATKEELGLKRQNSESETDQSESKRVKIVRINKVLGSVKTSITRMI